ncbi:MAG: class I SAM-dependent methyltransferase, partial [Actinobacteria bacterium]|nr:class I SAM-dependent methyltransferase [Actinomycetota bacterium]
MPRHQSVKKEYWDKKFLQPGYSCLKNKETEILFRIGISGKDVVQLCCNNGVELLSLKNLGAKNTTGFDISDEAIKEAKERSALSGINSDFIRTDIYDIKEKYNSSFDICYISAGVLFWMP